jgi:hypothetical protein
MAGSRSALASHNGPRIAAAWHLDPAQHCSLRSQRDGSLRDLIESRLATL